MSKANILLEKIYKNIEAECIRENISIENLLNYILEKRNIKQTNNLKELCLDELNKLTQKITNFESNNVSTNNETDSIMILPLNRINQTLPEKISKIIDESKKRFDFSERFFFLITNRSTILGYFGVSIQEEPSPFDRYLYIYTFNLEKQVDNKSNLNYILNYIETVAKRENIFNVDLNNDIVSIKKQVLRDRGYIQFGATGVIRLNKTVIEGSQHIKMNRENKAYTIEYLKDYLPIERTKPISELFNISSEQRIEKLVYNKGNEIEEVYITLLSDTKYKTTYVNIFFNPLSLYDGTLLHDCLLEILRYLSETWEYDLLIGLPLDILNDLDSIDYVMLNEVHWYRKVITYIKK